MIIENKLLRKFYIINLLLIIILFITPLIIYFINYYSNIHIYPYIDIDSILFIIYYLHQIIGMTFGLTFLFINIIVLIKYKKIIFLIITIFVLLWVIYAFYISLFDYMGILSSILRK